MSIKTNKRLALGVIAALVFAPFAAIAPANAAGIIADSFTATGGAATAASTSVIGSASTVAVIFSGIAGAANNDADVSGTVQSSPITSSAATVTFADTAGATQVNSTFTGGSNVIATAAGRATRFLTASFTPDVAGTYVIKLASTDAVNNAFVTWTVTATAVGAATAANSTSFLNVGEAVGATADAVVSASRDISAAAQAASIVVTPINAALADLTATAVLTATISGPGTLGISNVGGVAGQVATGRALTGTAGQNVIGVFSDGVSGVATITISAGTTVLATETVTFYGAVATLTASPVQAWIPDTADGLVNTDTDAIAAIIVARDAAGVQVPGVVGQYTVSSTVEKTAQEVTNAAVVLAAAGTVNGVVLKTTDLVLVVDATATKTGAKTLTVTHTTTTIATTVSFNVSLEAANLIVLTADKTTYLPGELVTVTLTARDKNGAVIANGPGTALLAGALTSSLSITSTLFGVNVVTKNGTATATFYAPPVTGTVVLSGTSGAAGTYVETLYAAKAITLSIPVALPVVPVVVPPVVYDNPTLSFVKDGGRVILSGTAVDGEGDIIIYTKKVGTTAWKERAKTLEVAAPGDFNGSMKAPKSNVLIRVKQEGTGQFSNQIIVLK